MFFVEYGNCSVYHTQRQRHFRPSWTLPQCRVSATMHTLCIIKPKATHINLIQKVLMEHRLPHMADLAAHSHCVYVRVYTYIRTRVYVYSFTWPYTIVISIHANRLMATRTRAYTCVYIGLRIDLRSLATKSIRMDTRASIRTCTNAVWMSQRTTNYRRVAPSLITHILLIPFTLMNKVKNVL